MTKNAALHRPRGEKEPNGPPARLSRRGESMPPRVKRSTKEPPDSANNGSPARQLSARMRQIRRPQQESRHESRPQLQNRNAVRQAWPAEDPAAVDQKWRGRMSPLRWVNAFRDCNLAPIAPYLPRSRFLACLVGCPKGPFIKTPLEFDRLVRWSYQINTRHACFKRRPIWSQVQ